MMKKAARYNQDRFQLNNRMMWPIFLIIVLAPYAFGSMRPALWLFWAICLCVCGVWCFTLMATSKARFRISVQDMPVVLGLFLLMGAYMVIQVIPIGTMAPTVISSAAPQDPISIPTISLTPGNTVLALVKWLSFGMLFFFVLQITANKQRANLFIRLLYWSVVLHAVLALVFLLQLGDTLLGLPKLAYLGSATGGFVNRNSFATFLSFGATLGTCLIVERLSSGSSGKRSDPSMIATFLDEGGVVPLTLGWLIILITLVATNSRMGLVAGVCGIVIATILGFVKKSKTEGNRAVWIFLGFLVASLIVAFVLYGASLAERFAVLEQNTDIRHQLYLQIFDMIRDRPLVGFGGDSFEYAYPLYHQLPVSFDYIWNRAHSVYLSLWVDYGLLFGSIPLAILAILMFKLCRAFARSDASETVIQSGIAVMVVAAVHSLVDFSLEIQGVTFMFIGIIAAATARYIEFQRSLEGKLN